MTETNDDHLPAFQLTVGKARERLGRLVDMAELGDTTIGITKNVPAADVATTEPRAVLISYAKYLKTQAPALPFDARDRIERILHEELGIAPSSRVAHRIMQALTEGS